MLFSRGDGAAKECIAAIPHFRYVALLVTELRPKRDPGRPRKRTPNFKRLKNPGFIHGSII